MSENLDLTPELTLTPDLSAPPAAPDLSGSAAATAAAEAIPLTLTPNVSPAAPATQQAEAAPLDESQLTEAERKMVADFAEKIDIRDSSVVLQYGAPPRRTSPAFPKRPWITCAPRIWARWARP